MFKEYPRHGPRNESPLAHATTPTRSPPTDSSAHISERRVHAAPRQEDKIKIPRGESRCFPIGIWTFSTSLPLRRSSAALRPPPTATNPSYPSVLDPSSIALSLLPQFNHQTASPSEFIFRSWLSVHGRVAASPWRRHQPPAMPGGDAAAAGLVRSGG